jgi:hypothetical protein
MAMPLPRVKPVQLYISCSAYELNLFFTLGFNYFNLQRLNYTICTQIICAREATRRARDTAYINPACQRARACMCLRRNLDQVYSIAQLVFTSSR